MGIVGAGRFLQSVISRERPWEYIKRNEAEDDTPTSGSFGYDQASKEILDWEELGYSDERDLGDPDDR